MTLNLEMWLGARVVVTGSAPLWSVAARLRPHRFSGLDGGDGDCSGAGNVLAGMVRLVQLSSLRRRGGSCKGAVA